MYTPDPSWCAVAYSYTIDIAAGNDAITFDDDPASRLFTFDNISDLALSGATSLSYQITVTGQTGNTVPQ